MSKFFQSLLHPLPSGVIVYIGSVGSGKTTHAAMITQHALRQGVHVFTNIPELAGEGVTIIEGWMIGHFDISNGLLVFDECGIEYNNRLSMEKGKMSVSQSGSKALEDKLRNRDNSWSHLKQLKAMNAASIRWWKLIRHYHCSAVVYSQAQDFDVTIRRLASKMYIIKKSLLPWWSTWRRLAPHWVTDEVTGDPRLQWSFVPLSKRWIFRPRWYKYFNSWSAPVLPPLPSPEQLAAEYE